MCLKIILIFYFINIVHSRIDLLNKNPAIDTTLLESVLDSELCDEQFRYLNNDNFLLRLQFLDAGLRLPRGILTGNFVDLGNYHQCLEIHQELQEYDISGKYCLVDIPIDQELKISELPELFEIPWPEWLPRKQELNISNENHKNIDISKALINHYDVGKMSGGGKSFGGNFNVPSITMRLAMCLPKPCTTQQALANLYLNISAIGFKYNDVYCRLPEDKPWVAGDIVAITILSIIGLITILSTGYSIYRTIIKKQDSKDANNVLSAFSLYVNTRNFFVFKSNPRTIECLDGIRALAMAWVIIAHTFMCVGLFPVYNGLDVAQWITSTRSLWIQGALLSVDTFFMLSGLLLVYTTVGKFTGKKLLKNLHLFYLNRLLRLFPILAFAILLEMSVMNRVSDGPLWPILIVPQVNTCRTYWWSTLLHLQNYMNPDTMCLPHTWYVTIDTHLHIISPLVLYWVLSGSKRYAWISLSSGLLASLVAVTGYIFYNNFSNLLSSPQDDRSRYMIRYYYNTLTRAPPFFVGMIFGYILHTYRSKQIKLPKVYVWLFWILAWSSSTLAVYTNILEKKPEYDNQLLENFKNSYIRSIWATAVGWMIFSCVHGYSGPINWFLSLKQWKPLSRLSYGMYLLHMTPMFIDAASQVTPAYFTVGASVYKFLSHFLFTSIFAFVATVVIDAPCSTFIKLALNGGPKKPT